jgi:hypothetical protein
MDVVISVSTYAGTSAFTFGIAFLHSLGHEDTPGEQGKLPRKASGPPSTADIHERIRYGCSLATAAVRDHYATRITSLSASILDEGSL